MIGGFQALREAGLPVLRLSPCLGSDVLPGGGPPSACRGERQRSRWEEALRKRRDRYGSARAPAAVERLAREGGRDLLELCGGQDRDTLVFAEAGLQVAVCDFAGRAAETVARKAEAQRIAAIELDVRGLSPFAGASFHCCYSQMHLCMALDERELHALAGEIRRVLRAGRLCIYTAPTRDDPDYGQGVHHGEGLYELNGFAVHFFDRSLVERLAEAHEPLQRERFGEGDFARRLSRVTMREP